MIVFGGLSNTSYLNSGGIFDPATDSWTSNSTANIPDVRTTHTAVWTGSKMIVFGGENNGTTLNSGGMYYPASDSWTSTSTTNAPSARHDHTAVFTGSKMIVFGGYGDYVLNSGSFFVP